MDHIAFKKKNFISLLGSCSSEHSSYPGSKFVRPPSDTSSEDEEVLLRVDEKKPSLDTLNTYLAARDISPVRSQLQTPWEKASARTKRYYTHKAGQATVPILNDISPQASQSLFSEVPPQVCYGNSSS